MIVLPPYERVCTGFAWVVVLGFVLFVLATVFVVDLVIGFVTALGFGGCTVYMLKLVGSGLSTNHSLIAESRDTGTNTSHHSLNGISGSDQPFTFMRSSKANSYVLLKTKGLDALVS